MEIDEEIEKIESIIADIESAISEAKGTYFEYKVDAWEDDLRDLNERLEELENIQDAQWKIENRDLEHEYWSSVL